MLQVQQFLTPFHLPGVRVAELSCPSIKDHLHSIKKWERMLSSHHNVELLPCPCTQYRYRVRLTNDCLQDGHVMCGFEQFVTALRPLAQRWLADIAEASANSSYFLGKDAFMQHTMDRLTRWIHREGLPKAWAPLFQTFLEEQWKHHLFELSINPRLSWKTVQHAKQCLSQFLVHCEDHAPHHLMVYCPRAYFQAAWRTWNDPDVFTKLEEEPADTKARLLSSIPKSLSKRYPWAFDMKGSLAYGYILPKRKKAFRTGRTIISYSRSGIRHLLQANALCIRAMVSTCWSSGYGLKPMPVIWKEIHRWMQTFDSELELFEFNVDLIGFFNSVPRDMIMNSLQDLIQLFRGTTEASCFAVDLTPGKRFERAFLGKPPRGLGKHQHLVFIEDIVACVRLSFQFGAFEAAALCGCNTEAPVSETR